MASVPGHSPIDSNDFSWDDIEYLTPNNVAETTAERNNCTACFLTAARLYLHLPPEASKFLVQINPNLNNYHSIPMEISSTVYILDITDWWHQ